MGDEMEWTCQLTVGPGMCRYSELCGNHVINHAMPRWYCRVCDIDICSQCGEYEILKENQGKTSEFARLPEQDKVQVLQSAGVDTRYFIGRRGEGKTALFARLPGFRKEASLRDVSQGRAAELYLDRARQYEGKTTQFSRMSSMDKLEVLEAAGVDTRCFNGYDGEGKTATFAGLPEHVKQHALRQQQVQGWAEEGSAMAQFASLSNEEKVYVLQLAGDSTPWTGINGEGKNGAFDRLRRSVQLRALTEAGFR